MDPKACFEAMLKWHGCQDWEAYDSARCDLLEWFQRGGFGFEAKHVRTGDSIKVVHIEALGGVVYTKGKRGKVQHKCRLADIGSF